MRIAITGQTYYPGNNGQAIFTIHLAEGLARAGHEVAVIIPGWDFKHHLEYINGVCVHQVRVINAPWLHPEARYSFLPQNQINKIFQEFRPQVVHLQDHYFLSRDVANTAHRLNIPVVGSNHFLPENILPYFQALPLPRQWKINILWDLMLWTYNHLKVVVTPTETAARILRAQKIRVPVKAISCGVDTNHFYPAPNLNRRAACQQFGLNPDKSNFLYVGRLDREKRADLLMRGLAIQSKAGSREIHLVIAGQGSAKGELRALAYSLGLEDRVHFLGYVSSDLLPLLYQTADVFCMPSPEELQSIASLEAMASGRPVLAANARALPELVTPGLNGYLFEPGKAEAVARGMDYLLEQRCEWERMGRASRLKAEMHSLENTLRRFEEVYEQAIGLPPRSLEEPADLVLDRIQM